MDHSSVVRSSLWTFRLFPVSGYYEYSSSDHGWASSPVVGWGVLQAYPQDGHSWMLRCPLPASWGTTTLNRMVAVYVYTPSSNGKVCPLHHILTSMTLAILTGVALISISLMNPNPSVPQTFVFHLRELCSTLSPTVIGLLIFLMFSGFFFKSSLDTLNITHLLGVLLLNTFPHFVAFKFLGVNHTHKNARNK